MGFDNDFETFAEMAEDQVGSPERSSLPMPLMPLMRPI